MKKVLIVCLGNICRSPTAEAVLKERAKRFGGQEAVASLGANRHHRGKSPDNRPKAARRNAAIYISRKNTVENCTTAFFDVCFII